MSGLEKFEASESWRTYFKKFLFVERKPPAKKTVTAISDTQRYSLDVGKDLQELLRERKKLIEIQKPTSSKNEEGTPGEDNNMSYSIPSGDDEFCGSIKHNVDILEKVSDESFEVMERMCEKTASDVNSTLFRYLHGDEAGTQSHSESVWQKTSDESFEALERMCDKTASDPDSTLFQYLHSDHKDEVLADAKKRSTDGNTGTLPEIDGVNNDMLGKFSDCTLLDDIEAPSRMWENTITVDAGFRTSPVKMVGLMRPSTIIEEAADESANSEISSQASFQTATTKGALSDISIVYDTAHDSTTNSTHTNSSNQRSDEREINVDELLMLALSSQTSYIPSLNETDAEINTASVGHNNTSDTSVDLIDLEKTFGPNYSSSHSIKIEGDTTVDVVVIEDDDRIEGDAAEDTDRDDEDTSVIDILSDEEDDRLEDYNDINEYNYSHTDLSFEENKENYTDERSEENKENYTFESSLSERSMKFNDTMEEVEYLLKKGMEYMAARENVVIANSEISNAHPVEEPKTSVQSENKDTIPPPYSASKVKLPSSSTFIKTPNKNAEPSENRYAIDMRPFPKLDIFGRSPQATIGHPRRKELANKQFAHVVSPIGTYMKKTASTPLMSTCKMKNSKVLNSLASRELEYEARLCQPKFGTHSSDLHTQTGSGLAAIPGISGTQKTLPKKAYISSELKHIIDERTPVTIPGGKKIQKYLENAMMPAVLRHDGKMKIAGSINSSPATMAAQSSKVPLKMHNSNTASTVMSHRNNASLADLSVMSGDVSMYTIMDAQKF